VTQIFQHSSQKGDIESQVKVQDEEQNVAKLLQITEFLYAEKVLYLFTRKNSTVTFFFRDDVSDEELFSLRRRN